MNKTESLKWKHYIMANYTKLIVKKKQTKLCDDF